MPKPSITFLLKEIKSDDIETVYIHVTNKAVEWAVAGFMEEANRLLEKLWSFGTPHSGHLWVPDQGFIVMWHLSGKRPGNVPFEDQDIAGISHTNYSGLFMVSTLQNHISAIPNHSIEAVGEYILAASKNLAIGMTDEEIAGAIAGYEAAMKGAEGYWFFEPATRGAILSARTGDIVKAEYFIRRWAESYFAYQSNYTLAYLMRDPATAAILLTGLIAPVWGLTKEGIDADFEAIAAALDARYAEGRGLVYGALSWHELLSKISRLAIEQGSNDFSEDVVGAGWLGAKPALGADIDAAEARLGVTLPQDYKAFLRASNGFAAISCTDVALAPVSEIKRYRDVDAWSVDLWSDGQEEPEWGEPFKNCIMIGGFKDEQELLLLPFPDGSWACWFFAHWVPGEHRYPSLRYYMEDRLQRLEEGFYA